MKKDDIAQYPWLALDQNLPKMVRHALSELGTREAAGAADNPRILAWAREIGGALAHQYPHDAIPWCGLFMAVIAKRAGKPLPLQPLWALSWAQFGTVTARAALGDVLVFKRTGGGHVGLYVGEDQSAFHVLGGNQADRVGFARIARTRLHAVRRPPYWIAPASVLPYRLAAAGALSSAEA